MARRKKIKKSFFSLFLILATVFIAISSFVISNSKVTKQNAEAAIPPWVSFPKDHGQHPNFQSEWWYLNILTRTTKFNGTSQKDLGYVISFSRIAGSKGLLSSRYDNSSKTFAEKTDIGGSLSGVVSNSLLKVSYSKGATKMTFQEITPASNGAMRFTLKGYTPQVGTFNLKLVERTVKAGGNTPLLWGCTGNISVFDSNDTYYYSMPDFDVTGTITDVDGVRRTVKIGKMWFDHQWFNSVPPNDWKGHYWTSFHYTFSSDLYSPGPHQAIGFVTQIYNNGPKNTYWVRRNANGTNECGEGGSIVINSYGPTNYPSSWKVELKKLGSVFLTASGSSFSANQIFKPPIGPSFFEPASFYSGSTSGKAFTGLGFFETHIKK